VGSAALGLLLIVLVLLQTLRYRMEEARIEEMSQLQFENLADATCSSDKDRERILKAIAGKEADVEAAIRTLMQQGMSTAELRRRSVTVAPTGPLHDSSGLDMSNGSGTISSQGYKDLGSAVMALLLWPVYLWCSWQSLDNGAMDRVHFLCFSFGCTCYPMCAWAHFRCDPDLATLVLRAALYGVAASLVCGLAFGFWGIAGGIAFATCIVADRCHRVQKVQMRYFECTLMPLAVLGCATVSWQAFAALFLDVGCICIQFELVAISGLWLFFSCVTRATMRFFERSRVEHFWARTFAMCACGNSCLVAICLYLETQGKSKWFFLEEWHLHEIFIGLKQHAMYSSVCLLASGTILPAWVLVRLRRRKYLDLYQSSVNDMELVLVD